MARNRPANLDPRRADALHRCCDQGEVHRFQGELAQQGMAIILVSSELPKVLEISDNIIVMHQGLITGRFRREEATPETVLKVALAQPEPGNWEE